ncbi:MAG: LLM class flavin-dependent oxidoreductase [Pseudomonadales bacterium]|jgi:5,10-methylenetetrahydromethanopterin reductase|nr:LLM class flavin-dependent oxidoreductase [Gammaproteobacteria bacterium]
MAVAFGLNRLEMSSPTAFGQSAARAESLGWQYGFVPSSPLLVQDPYVMLAEALRRTEAIKLGPLIENPVMRHPAVIAGSIATVDRIAPGRTLVGLGVGDTAVRLMGRSPARVKTLESATDLIKRLLAGESVEAGAQRPARLRHASAVPVWIAAQGPKTLRMAGRVADGVFIRVGTTRANIAAAIEEIHAGAREAGRDPGSIALGLVLHVVLCDDPEREEMVARSIAAGYYEYSPMLFERCGVAWDGPDVESLKARVWPDFHHARDLYASGREVAFLPHGAVDAFSLHGDLGAVKAQLEHVLDFGFPIEVVVPHPVPAYAGADGPAIDYMKTFAEGVIQAMR